MFSESIEDPTHESKAIVERVSGQIWATQLDIQSWTHEYIKNHKKRIAVDLDLSNKWISKDAHIIELGSAPYLFTLSASECGFNVAGVDIAPERFRDFIETNNLDIHACDIEREQLPFPDEFADAVIANELFEHMRIDINFTFHEVLRVLKPGGKIFISTPNLRSASGMYNFLRRGRSFSLSGSIYREYSKLQSLGHMGHVREYTRNDITQFLSEVGFAPKGVYWRGRYSNWKYQLAARFVPSLKPFQSIIAEKPIRCSANTTDVKC